jgi:hypothetical protein
MPDARPSDLAARLRGAATGPAPAPAPVSRPAPPPRPAGPEAPARTKFTMLLEPADADALEEITTLLGRQLGRRKVDRSEALRGLVRLARRDLSILAQLAEDVGR